MLIFLKQSLRDLKEAKGQFISVLAVVIIGSCLYRLYNAAGLFSGAGQTYFTEYRLADLGSTVTGRRKECRAEQGDSRSPSGGKSHAGCADLHADRNAMVRLISLRDQKPGDRQRHQLKAGSDFSADAANQCVSEDFFKPISGYRQTIEPIVNGDGVKLSIVGTANRPRIHV